LSAGSNIVHTCVRIPFYLHCSLGSYNRNQYFVQYKVSGVINIKDYNNLVVWNSNIGNVTSDGVAVEINTSDNKDKKMSTKDYIQGKNTKVRLLSDGKLEITVTGAPVR
jgi:hypothetical protein